jgi:chemotaxis protein methyltransferase CheR
MTRAVTATGSGPDLSDAEFADFQALVLRATGISLTEAKRQLVCSRLSKRLRHLDCDSYGAYYRLLTDPGHADEMQQMINCITTNKTDFFREPHHFRFLEEAFAQHDATQGGRVLQLWSAGCSTGEEPYSIAMLAREHYGHRAGGAVDILATDIDTEVLGRAERAVYAADRVDGMAGERVRRHFLRGARGAAGQVQVRPEVRALVRFQQVNLTLPPWEVPEGFDVIFCRNVIIYFNRETQERLMRAFAARLRPGGHLILGHSENLMWLSDLFEPLGETVYRLRQVRGVRAPKARVAPGPEPLPVIRLVAGDVKASGQSVVLRTFLGSCVAACLYDPEAGIGGMNHFLLPDGDQGEGLPNRFGVHAMELLINEIMHLGGDRRRLRAKIFGAANVLEALRQRPSVAEQNAAFIRRFLATEQIPVDGEKLGGRQALEVLFYPRTGRVQVRTLGVAQARAEELAAGQYRRAIESGVGQPVPDAMLLFGGEA